MAMARAPSGIAVPTLNSMHLTVQESVVAGLASAGVFRSARSTVAQRVLEPGVADPIGLRSNP